MTALRMRGRQICNYQRLREHFDISALFGQPDAFAALANAHLRFDAAREDCAKAFAVAAAAYKNSSELPAEPDSLMSLLTDKTALDERERRAVSRMLSSAYALAGFTLEDKPLTAGDIEAAVKGQANGDGAKQDGSPAAALLSDGADTLPLPAGHEAYRFRLYAKKALSEGERIRTVKLLAAPSRNQSRHTRVVIELIKGDTPGQRLELKPGEFVYANAVGGEIVKILPQSVANGGCKLERHDLAQDTLQLVTPDGSVRKLASTRGKASSSFAPEGGGFLAVQNQRLNTGNYPNRRNYPQLSTLEYRRVVEVAISGGNYLVLQDNGRVCSSSGDWDTLRGLPSLDGIVSKGAENVRDRV